MKFVNHHRLDILMAIERHQLLESDFDFIKRRGRIHTKHRDTGLEFAYLRIKETHLDPLTREWKNTEQFKVKSSNNKEQTVPNWELVMELFEKWLIQF